jgi:uncharacterized protein (DUF1800 family)
MGKTGNLNGNDIIDLLLEQQQTANYVTRKVFTAFVNPDVDQEWVNELSVIFYKSNYDIGRLMRSIFLDDRFYLPKHKGAIISSPVELIVRYKKLISLETKIKGDMIKVQKVLGQVLFFPPNVAGWPGGRNWIDSSSLRMRMDMPRSIVEGGGFDIRPKPEFEDDPLAEDITRAGKNALVKSDWSVLIKYFLKINRQDLTHQIVETFLQVPADESLIALVEQYVDHSTPEKQVISTCAAVMSLPEFQLI